MWQIYTVNHFKQYPRTQVWGFYPSCLTPGSFVCSQSEDHRQLNSSTVSGCDRSGWGLLPVRPALLGHRCCSTYHYWSRWLCDWHHRSARLYLILHTTGLFNWLFRQTFHFLLNWNLLFGLPQTYSWPKSKREKNIYTEMFDIHNDVDLIFLQNSKYYC